MSSSRGGGAGGNGTASGSNNPNDSKGNGGGNEPPPYPRHHHHHHQQHHHHPPPHHHNPHPRGPSSSRHLGMTPPPSSSAEEGEITSSNLPSSRHRSTEEGEISMPSSSQSGGDQGSPPHGFGGSGSSSRGHGGGGPFGGGGGGGGNGGGPGPPPSFGGGNGPPHGFGSAGVGHRPSFHRHAPHPPPHHHRPFRDRSGGSVGGGGGGGDHHGVGGGGGGGGHHHAPPPPRHHHHHPPPHHHHPRDPRSVHPSHSGGPPGDRHGPKGGGGGGSTGGDLRHMGVGPPPDRGDSRHSSERFGGLPDRHGVGLDRDIHRGGADLRHPGGPERDPLPPNRGMDRPTNNAPSSSGLGLSGPLPTERGPPRHSASDPPNEPPFSGNRSPPEDGHAAPPPGSWRGGTADRHRSGSSGMSHFGYGGRGPPLSAQPSGSGRPTPQSSSSTGQGSSASQPPLSSAVDTDNAKKSAADASDGSETNKPFQKFNTKFLLLSPGSPAVGGSGAGGGGPGGGAGSSGGSVGSGGGGVGPPPPFGGSSGGTPQSDRPRWSGPSSNSGGGPHSSGIDDRGGPRSTLGGPPRSFDRGSGPHPPSPHWGGRAPPRGVDHRDAPPLPLWKANDGPPSESTSGSRDQDMTSSSSSRHADGPPHGREWDRPIDRESSGGRKPGGLWTAGGPASTGASWDNGPPRPGSGVTGGGGRLDHRDMPKPFGRGSMNSGNSVGDYTNPPVPRSGSGSVPPRGSGLSLGPRGPPVSDRRSSGTTNSVNNNSGNIQRRGSGDSPSGGGSGAGTGTGTGVSSGNGSNNGDGYYGPGAPPPPLSRRNIVKSGAPTESHSFGGPPRQGSGSDPRDREWSGNGSGGSLSETVSPRGWKNAYSNMANLAGSEPRDRSTELLASSSSSSSSVMSRGQPTSTMRSPFDRDSRDALTPSIGQVPNATTKHEDMDRSGDAPSQKAPPMKSSERDGEARNFSASEPSSKAPKNEIRQGWGVSKSLLSTSSMMSSPPALSRPFPSDDSRKTTDKGSDDVVAGTKKVQEDLRQTGDSVTSVQPKESTAEKSLTRQDLDPIRNTAVESRDTSVKNAKNSAEGDESRSVKGSATAAGVRIGEKQATKEERIGEDSKGAKRTLSEQQRSQGDAVDTTVRPRDGNEMAMATGDSGAGDMPVNVGGEKQRSKAETGDATNVLDRRSPKVVDPRLEVAKKRGLKPDPLVAEASRWQGASMEEKVPQKDKTPSEVATERRTLEAKGGESSLLRPVSDTLESIESEQRVERPTDEPLVVPDRQGRSASSDVSSAPTRLSRLREEDGSAHERKSSTSEASLMTVPKIGRGGTSSSTEEKQGNQSPSETVPGTDGSQKSESSNFGEPPGVLRKEGSVSEPKSAKSDAGTRAREEEALVGPTSDQLGSGESKQTRVLAAQKFSKASRSDAGTEVLQDKAIRTTQKIASTAEQESSSLLLVGDAREQGSAVGIRKGAKSDGTTQVQRAKRAATSTADNQDWTRKETSSSPPFSGSDRKEACAKDISKATKLEAATHGQQEEKAMVSKTEKPDLMIKERSSRSQGVASASKHVPTKELSKAAKSEASMKGQREKGPVMSTTEKPDSTTKERSSRSPVVESERKQVAAKELSKATESDGTLKVQREKVPVTATTEKPESSIREQGPVLLGGGSKKSSAKAGSKAPKSDEKTQTQQEASMTATTDKLNSTTKLKSSRFPPVNESKQAKEVSNAATLNVATQAQTRQEKASVSSQIEKSEACTSMLEEKTSESKQSSSHTKEKSTSITQRQSSRIVSSPPGTVFASSTRDSSTPHKAEAVESIVASVVKTSKKSTGTTETESPNESRKDHATVSSKVLDNSDVSRSSADSKREKRLNKRRREGMDDSAKQVGPDSTKVALPPDEQRSVKGRSEEAPVSKSKTQGKSRVADADGNPELGNADGVHGLHNPVRSSMQTEGSDSNKIGGAKGNNEAKILSEAKRGVDESKSSSSKHANDSEAPNQKRLDSEKKSGKKSQKNVSESSDGARHSEEGKETSNDAAKNPGPREDKAIGSTQDGTLGKRTPTLAGERHCSDSTGSSYNGKPSDQGVRRKSSGVTESVAMETTSQGSSAKLQKKEKCEGRDKLSGKEASYQGAQENEAHSATSNIRDKYGAPRNTKGPTDGPSKPSNDTQISDSDPARSKGLADADDLRSAEAGKTPSVKDSSEGKKRKAPSGTIGHSPSPATKSSKATQKKKISASADRAKQIDPDANATDATPPKKRKADTAASLDETTKPEKRKKTKSSTKDSGSKPSLTCASLGTDKSSRAERAIQLLSELIPATGLSAMKEGKSGTGTLLLPSKQQILAGISGLDSQIKSRQEESSKLKAQIQKMMQDKEEEQSAEVPDAKSQTLSAGSNSGVAQQKSVSSSAKALPTQTMDLEEGKATGMGTPPEFDLEEEKRLLAENLQKELEEKKNAALSSWRIESGSIREKYKVAVEDAQMEMSRAIKRRKDAAASAEEFGARALSTQEELSQAKVLLDEAMTHLGIQECSPSLGGAGTADLVASIISENQRRAAMAHAESLSAIPFTPMPKSNEAESPMERSNEEWSNLARQVSGFSDALYRQPSETPMYHENQKTHEVIAPLITEHVRAKRKKLKHRWEDLATEYVVRRKVFDKKLKKAGVSTTAHGASVPVTDATSILSGKRRTMSGDDVGDPLKTNAATSSIRSSGNPYRRPRRGGPGGSSSIGGDVVRSEYEQEQIIKELSAKDAMERRIENGSCTLPRQRCSLEMELYPQYVDDQRSRLVEDPAVDEAESQYVCPWSDVEKCIFLDRFLQHPKDFKKISSFLKNKSTKDCVAFYYNSKQNVPYKAALKEHLLRRKRRGESTSWEATIQAAISVGAVISIGNSSEKPLIFTLPQDDNTFHTRSFHPMKREVFDPIKTSGDDNSAKSCEGGTTDAGFYTTRFLLDPSKRKYLRNFLNDDTGSKKKGASEESGGVVTKQAKSSSVGTSGSSLESVLGLSPAVAAIIRKPPQKWTDAEKKLFFEFVDKHGKNWGNMRSVLGSKPVSQMKIFYSEYKRHLGRGSLQKPKTDESFAMSVKSHDAAELAGQGSDSEGEGTKRFEAHMAAIPKKASALDRKKKGTSLDPKFDRPEEGQASHSISSEANPKKDGDVAEGKEATALNDEEQEPRQQEEPVGENLSQPQVMEKPRSQRSFATKSQVTGEETPRDRDGDGRSFSSSLSKQNRDEEEHKPQEEPTAAKELRRFHPTQEYHSQEGEGQIQSQEVQQQLSEQKHLLEREKLSLQQEQEQTLLQHRGYQQQQQLLLQDMEQQRQEHERHQFQGQLQDQQQQLQQQQKQEQHQHDRQLLQQQQQQQQQHHGQQEQEQQQQRDRVLQLAQKGSHTGVIPNAAHAQQQLLANVGLPSWMAAAQQMAQVQAVLQQQQIDPGNVGHHLSIRDWVDNSNAAAAAAQLQKLNMALAIQQASQQQQQQHQNQQRHPQQLDQERGGIRLGSLAMQNFGNLIQRPDSSSDATGDAGRTYITSGQSNLSTGAAPTHPLLGRGLSQEERHELHRRLDDTKGKRNM